MTFDDYDAPGAARLLELREQRFLAPARARRTLITELLGAVAFLTAAGGVALLAPGRGGASPLVCGSAVALYLVASRIRFPVGSAWTYPTQLVYVPMLFLLPTRLVPLIVGLCTVLDAWPHLITRDLSLTRVLARLGDSAYAIGPAVVLIAFGHSVLAWGDWPVWILALGAQIACDATSGALRTWFAEGVSPRLQPQMLWLYLTDACLACVSLPLAAVSARRPGLMLLTLPLLAMLWLLAQERQQRLDHSVRLSSAYRGTAMLLGDMVEADDTYTGRHSRGVLELALALADQVGLSESRRRDVEFAALLHDVGKVRVPKRIINKPGRLDAAEWRVIRRHTIEGEAMLGSIGGTLGEVGRIIRSHHERWDGAGYPDGLRGGEIPIEARIVCVCDAFNAMTTDRPYRRAMSPEAAMAEMRREAGRQFDPEIVAALEALLALEPPTPVCAGEPARTRNAGLARDPLLLGTA